MLGQLRRAVVITLVFFVLLGLVYPLVATGVARVVFPGQASGSLVRAGDRVVGSSLVGQQWKGPQWFQGRPDGDDPMASGASNLGPRSATLAQDTAKFAAALRRDGIDPTNDLTTGSGSGIDPDISPADAYAQAPAVASARHLPLPRVKALVASQVRGADLGFLGAPTVDVLALNLALARLR